MTRFPALALILAAPLAAAPSLAGCGGGGTEPENRSPAASITSPSDGTTVIEGVEVTFVGSGSDPEGGALTGSSLDWESDLDGLLGRGSPVRRSDLSVGEHVVTLTATDEEGASGTTTVSITVAENSEPSAAITSPPDGTVFGQWAPIRFKGSGDDPEDGSLTGSALTWDSDVDGPLGTGASLTLDDLSAGKHTVTLTATDFRGAAATAAVSLTVEPNGRPAAAITAPSDGEEFDEDVPIAFEGSGSDPDDGALSGGSLVWTSDMDGQIGTGASFSRSDLSSGGHTITLEATDSRGASATASVGITVRGEPSVTIHAPSDESVFQHESAVSFRGSAADPAEGILTGASLVWTSSLDGELGTGESLARSDLSRGGHVVTLTATDSEGVRGTASIRILVEAPGFQIQARLLDDVAPARESSLEAALGRWEAAITGNLESGFPPEPDPSFHPDVNACLDGAGGVDDLLVCVFVRDLDGPGGALAGAGPFFARTAGGLPAVGGIVIDETDLSLLSADQLRIVLTHEVGHVLGIGALGIEAWADHAVGVETTIDPFFDGTEARAAFDDVGGVAYLSDGVPLENGFGPGTRGVHWREANLDEELMTGILDAESSNPLSVVTLAALADMGYEVDPSAAASYGLPMPQAALWEAEADATLSEPASAAENFGVPDGSALSTSLVAGANDGVWSTDPDGETLTGLVRFGVPALPPGVTVTSALLSLSRRDVDAGTTDHEIEVLGVEGSWSEASVTASSAPPVAVDPVVTFLHDGCASCTFTSDAFLALARGWTAGTAENHGLALRAPDASSDPTFSVGFWTREADAPERRPRMRIEARTDAPLRALEAPRSGGIPMVNDVLRVPVHGLTPDGRVITPGGRTLEGPR